MHLDATLNWIWLLLGLVAVASAAGSYYYRVGVSGRERKLSLLIGVAVIIAALFPYISSTDDSLRFDDLSAQHNQDHHPNKDSRVNGSLILLYEATDAAIPIQVFRLCVIWVITGLVVYRFFQGALASSPWVYGRSPPR